MYPVTIPGVADSFEEPPPLPHDSPPGRDLAKLQRSRSSGDASHRQRKSSSGQTSKPRSKAELTSEGGRVSCPEASRVVPQVSSPRSKKRRHRGRHRHHHSDLGPEDFRLNIPTNKPDATNGSTAPTLVPPSSSRGADSGDLSKSAPCDTWCLTDLDNGAEARSPEPRSTDKVDNPPFRLRSCTSPDYFSSMDQSRPSCRSWYNRACPFFATSLTGDDNAAEDIARIKALQEKESGSWLCSAFLYVGTLMDGEVLSIGYMKINSMSELRRLAGVKSMGDAECPTLLDIEIISEQDDPRQRPNFGVARSSNWTLAKASERPHIDVSLTCEHDPKLKEYCVCPQNMPQFDSEGFNQAPETNKPVILNGPTSGNREGSDQKQRALASVHYKNGSTYPLTGPRYLTFLQEVLVELCEDLPLALRQQIRAASAAELAVKKKVIKHAHLLDNYIFVPFAVKAFGPWSHDAKVLVSQIGQILISVTGDRRCTTYLRQQLSTITIQRGNGMSVLGTLPESSPLDELFLL
ncbi:hypothetical protein ANN_03727 [Periplaneta americana]|uniref:Uncharacterized protein n=1 Tax=Periplaneta americana TaxID=6978 RepID=A0ABQ8U480_PERAM|nr:hypothetical protein ANN_03727 [Periplaneta americana]